MKKTRRTHASDGRFDSTRVSGERCRGRGGDSASTAGEPRARPRRERGGARADRFSRIFDLRPFAEGTPRVQAALIELGAPGGLMDAKDPLNEGPSVSSRTRS